MKEVKKRKCCLGQTDFPHSFQQILAKEKEAGSITGVTSTPMEHLKWGTQSHYCLLYFLQISVVSGIRTGTEAQVDWADFRLFPLIPGGYFHVASAVFMLARIIAWSWAGTELLIPIFLWFHSCCKMSELCMVMNRAVQRFWYRFLITFVSDSAEHGKLH